MLSAPELDTAMIQRALALAESTTALATPNPRVGCVLTGGGRVLGEGAHLYERLDHAEVVALKAALAGGSDVRGATAYVTLEPCSHHGRTGPCADALIRAGVGRCVVATVDPNPVVSGRGIARLRAAGVNVSVGLLGEAARELNDAFAHSVRHGTPFVTLKSAVGRDGMLAPPVASRVAGRPHWVTGVAARGEVQGMRHGSDAILTGIGTVLADDPALTDRTGLPRRRPLLRVVLDRELRIPVSSQLVRSAADDVLVLCGMGVAPGRRSELEAAGVEVRAVAEDAGGLSLPAVLKELGERRLLSLLLETGSRLNGAFLAAGLVDRVVLFEGATELGEGAVPFAEGGPSPSELRRRLRKVTERSVGPDLQVTGYLSDPWSGVSDV